MKNRINKSLIVWIFTLIFLHVGMLIVYQKIIMRNTIQNQKERLFGLQQKKATVWAMGDSHPLLAFDPQWFPGSYNWAGISENYVLNYFKIKYLIKNSWRPKCIILSVEYHGLSTQGMELLKNHELDDSFWFDKISVNELAAHQSNASEYVRWKISAAGATYAGQFYQLASFFLKPPSPITEQGFQSTTEVFETISGKEQKLVSKVQSHSNYPMIDPIQILYLKKIIQWCEQEGISLVFVRYPIHPDYYQLLKEATNIQRIDSTYQTILNNQMVLDYRFCFNKELSHFSDPDHLNMEGAKVFTKMLSDSIKLLN